MIQVVPATSFHMSYLEDDLGIKLSGVARGVAAVDVQGIRWVQGVIVFDGWTENACMAHIWVPNPAALGDLIGPAFRYAFEFPGNKGVILCTVRDDNHKCKRLLAGPRGLGFKMVHRVKDGWARGIDSLLFEMRKQDCAWLHFERRRPNGKQGSTAAA